MPESYIKRNCKRILKIFQVQLGAAQQRETGKNDSFFVLHVDEVVRRLVRIRLTFRVKCATTKNEKRHRLTSLLSVCLLFHLKLHYRHYPVSTLLLSCIAIKLVRHGLN